MHASTKRTGTGRASRSPVSAIHTCLRSLSIFLVLLTVVFADMPSTFRTLPWEFMVGAAIIASYMIAAFAYMIGEGFSLPELRGWAANELYQITAVLIIVIMVFITVRIENSVFESFGFSPTVTNPNPSIMAGEEFLDVSREYLISVASSAYSSNMIVIALLKKIESKKYLQNNFFNSRDVVEQLHRSVKDMIGVAVGGIHISIGLMTAQQWFLDLIARTAFTIFLPLGILLRTFSFSRGIGAFFISIAISFYIVFPLTFLLDQKIVDSLICPDGVQTCDGQWKNIREIRLPNLSSMTNSNSIDNNVGEIIEGITSGFVGNFFVLFTEAAFAFVTFTMLTILNFVITAGVTRSISNIMGYDVRMGDIIKIL